ncbi:YcnI family protein [Streptomyces sp. RY43-2]|uniref:YcnI family protein n=1 Tax=Streptomyces macrolidinus TaxID=2952607 RepID=A0ABT0ZHT9_9ACTN|nr:YcnI family protein [Streptomyces macrolidinus]MCN9243122.1 YcnI family protein [Streptomyces macrolidinus]
MKSPALKILTPSSKLSRLAAVGATAASAVLVLSGPAFAHVSVQPEGEATKGGYAVVDFKVPNERDNASTKKLEISFPTDHPLPSVMPQPVDGWKAEVTKSKLDKPVSLHGQRIDEAVTKVTWTSTGKGIEPGYFQKFPLSIGPLPENTDQLVFKALQTYSDDQVVRWIEPQQKGQPEPNNPAPALELTAASRQQGASAEAASTSGDQGTKATSGSNSDTTARVLGLVGIVIGAAGVAYGVLAGRRRTPDAA